MKLFAAACGIAVLLLAGCGGSSSSNGGGGVSCGITCNPATYTATASPGTLTFGPTTVGTTSAAQTVTLANTGTGALTLSGVTFGSYYTGTAGTCGATLAAGTSCTYSVTYTPQASGSTGGNSSTLTIGDNATAGNQSVILSGTAISTPVAANTVDCSTTTGTGATSTGGACTALTIQGDPISAGGFHGYADPALRKDPNASLFNLGYSWAHTLADGTHVVELHLASSTNSGTTFTEAGTLWPTTTITNPSGNTIAAGTNYSSHEVVDLIPIPGSGTAAGQTTWVQAHEEYLVQPQTGIYDQRDQSLYVSVSAVNETTPTNPGTSLTGLYTAPEARLGAVSVDPVRNITQRISSLSAALSKCATFGQPALWYQNSVLYLALECGENATLGYDTHELSHYLFTTTPTGADATKWTWAYAGELATPTQAAAMGTLEGKTYQFFTEPEFVQGKSGQLYFMLTPSVFAPQTSQQPVIQYGCRTVPVTSLTATGITLATDITTSVLSYSAKITEADLYTGANEGPAACTYDPNSNLGIVIGRKYENDPTLGFDIFPVATGVNP